MKILLALLLTSSAFAQSCPHTLTRTPVGPVLVYQNGKLLNVSDYSSVTPAGKTMPTIAPLAFADQDAMSVVISRAVPLTITVPPSPPITYFSYAVWREDWVCSGSTTPPIPPPPPFPGCASDGTQGIQCAGGFSVTPASFAGAIVMSNDTNTGSFAMSTAAATGPFTVLLMPSCADGSCFGKFLHNIGVVQCPNLHPSIAKFNPVCQLAEWAVPGQ